MKLTDSIRYIKGVGEKKQLLFNKLGIYNAADVLYHLPRDYEDRTSVKPICELIDGESACIMVRLASEVKSFSPRRGLKMVQAVMSDGSSQIKVVWFNMPYMAQKLKPNTEYVLYGKVSYRGMSCEMVNPVLDESGNHRNTGGIVPIYPLTGGLTQKNIRDVINIVLTNAEEIPELIPTYILNEFKLMGIKEAMLEIHNPTDFEKFKQARYRLAFEELLTFQLGVCMVKGEKKKGTAPIFRDVKCASEFAKSLSFELTNAQKRVINDICRDLKSSEPMNRLVQGDVGSGKTMVAAAVMFVSIKSGYQAVMMAPTEILAKQHYNNFKKIFSKWNVTVAILIGGQGAAERRENLELIKSGRAGIIVGTHALISENVEFYRLGLAITDEQHRFGVRQRSSLSEKGESVHMLVMTATPIPRTLSLIAYGDLDISVIDELPPGRQPIETFAVNEEMRPRINSFIMKNINEGRQAYIVCPLVEESETLDAKSAIEYAENLKNKVFPSLEIGLIYGNMSNKEKEEVMSRFVSGELNILVSTTVIEVGVDVPNANVMVIENAERFGLSQLHQLRGRIGRGKYKSYCILISNDTGETARERMKVMCMTNDGFKISERDLELRGPGEYFGTRQHGLPGLKIANILTDMDILTEAQKAAAIILKKDRYLELDEHKYLKENFESKFISVGGRGILS